MKATTILAVITSLAAHSYAACTRVPDEEGQAMTIVENCPMQRDPDGRANGMFLCAERNAWAWSNTGNWCFEPG
ncbi:hypothetical protein F66182_1090 [Fusarium sp. NRRL 66182]|nr:hypothetical protein F66182_1090 [Fusarium sp. NRRL 66182]